MDFRRTKKFDRCANKKINLTTDRFDRVLSATLECPRTVETETPVNVRSSDARSSKGIENSYYGIGKGRVVCYYPETEYALKHLAQSATSAVCGDCPFARMTPLEASDELARRTEYKAEVAQNELRHLIAREALDAARAEIAAIETAAMSTPRQEL